MLVSIIIPCYNVENYIEQCLISALEQTYTNIEIIVIDNNSTDNTRTIVSELRKKYPRKIQFFEEKKQGAPAARNLGTIKANGEWIQYLDADDLLKPRKIEHQIRLIKESKSNPDLVFGTQIYQFKSGKKVIFEPHEGDVLQALYFSHLGNTSSSLFKKNAILRVKLWDENLRCGQEYDLFFKIITQNAIVIYDYQPSTIVRERKSGQITFSSPRENAITFLEARVGWTNYLSEVQPEWVSEHKEVIKDAYYKYILSLSRVDTLTAIKYHSKYLGKDYIPKAKRDNGIDRFQELGYRLFGFKKWIILQKKIIPVVKKILKR